MQYELHHESVASARTALHFFTELFVTVVEVDAVGAPSLEEASNARSSHITINWDFATTVTKRPWRGVSQSTTFNLPPVASTLRLQI